MSGTQTGRPFQAIAAMSLNRVIGNGNKIPWNNSDDLKWFKSKTLGHAILMGRKTFESIGRPLPNRRHLVLTRRPQRLLEMHSDVFGEFKEWRGDEEKKNVCRDYDFLLFRSINVLMDFSRQSGRCVFVCGGGEVYKQLLPSCSNLYLTRVKCEVEGDTFFPIFEDKFDLKEIVQEREAFRIEHWRHKV